MIVELTHSFLWHCHNPDFLLEGCNKFNTYCVRLEKQADKMFPEPKDESEEDKIKRLQRINKHKGDGFELFVEALFKLFPCDKRLALVENYQVNTTQDVGVDGHGICGYNNKPMTIQCKYRQHDYVLTANADHLTNFTSASMLHYNVDQKPDPITHKCNMMIVSSADSLNFFTDHEMFGQMVYALCRPEIRKLVDNNNSFWKFFAQSWSESLRKLRAT